LVSNKLKTRIEKSKLKQTEFMQAKIFEELLFAGKPILIAFGYALLNFVNGSRFLSNIKSRENETNITSINPDSNKKLDIEDEYSIKDYRDAAEDKLEVGKNAESNGDFESASDAYDMSLYFYKLWMSKSKEGKDGHENEVSNKINLLEKRKDNVHKLKRKQEDLLPVLRSGERSFQEAIAAHVQDDQTLAQLRFRQARDTFKQARKTIGNGNDSVFKSQMEVSVQPTLELSSTNSGLPRLPTSAMTELADTGIETVDDLNSSPEPPWTPAAVEELVADNTIDEDLATSLTLLSWWHGDGSFTFETAEAVARRQKQADYGFNHTD
jgi:hypothetical protein